MNPVQETVLLYYPKKPKYLPKIKSIFVQLGIQFRILDAASTAQKIGYLTVQASKKVLPMSLFQKFHNLCW